MKLIFTLLLFTCLIQPVYADENILKIKIDKKNNITLHYEFAEEIDKIIFNGEFFQARLASWVNFPKCFTFDGGTVKKVCNTKTFNKLQVTLFKNSFSANAMYPPTLHSAKDDHVAINLSYLLPLNPLNIDRIDIETPRKKTIYWGHQRFTKKLSIHTNTINTNGGNFLYIGESPIHHNGIDIAIDPSLPQWVGDIIERRSSDIIDFYEQHLGVSLSTNHLIVASYYPESTKNMYWGDVDNQGTISLRFYSQDKWQTPSAEGEDAVTEFLAHELFHLFNAREYSYQPDVNHRWLHESSAELAALLVSQQLGYATENTLTQAIQSHWQKCYQFHHQKIGDRHEDKDIINWLDYNCGVALNWAVITSNNTTENQQHDFSIHEKTVTSFFELWKTIFVNSDTKAYDVDDFTDAASALNLESTYLSLVNIAKQKTNPVIEWLNQHAINYDTQINMSSLISQTIKVTMGKNCNNKHGFWTLEDHYILDANTDCNGLTDNFKFNQINKINLFEQKESLLAFLSQPCQSLFLSMAENTQAIEFQCPDQWPEANDYKVLIFN